MKFISDGNFADPEKAMGKLLGLISAEKADTGRIPVGPVNWKFREVGGTIAEYGSAQDLALARGLIEMHPCGGYFIWTIVGLAEVVDGAVP